MGHSTFSSLAGLSLDALVQQGVFFLNFSLEGGWPRLPSTARVERAHSDRARSASKEGTWPLTLTPF
jgi:hypothetical protein